MTSSVIPGVYPKLIEMAGIGMWREMMEPQSSLLTEFLVNDLRRNDLLRQLSSSLRGGDLAAAPPSLRSDLLEFFTRHCVPLCATAGQDRIRTVYETLRDRLGNPARDGPKIAASLRDAAIKALTDVIVALDLPKTDARLVKIHVELLYRLLDGRPAGSGAAPVAGSAVQDALQDRRLLAAECLQILETAFPTLLGADAAGFVTLAAREAVRPLPGFPHTQLAAQVVSHLSAAYIQQQEEYRMGYSDCDDLSGAASPSADSDSGLDTDGVLAAAAEVLCLPGTTNAMYDEEDGLEVEFDSPCGGGETPLLSATPSPPAADGSASVGSATSPRVASGKGSPGVSSPRGIASAVPAPSTTTATVSKQSSRRSMLASVAEADEMDSASVGSLRTSALTTALRRSVSPTAAASVPPLTRTASDVSAIAWTGASTPRTSVVSEVVLLAPSTGSRAGEAVLRRFSVPVHIQDDAPRAIPRLILTPDAQAALQDAAATFLGAMRRCDAAGVARLAAALPPILRAARPSPTHLWPVFERQLAAGSTPLLRAVLDLHDELPELFEGRGPSLVEKVLAQVNDNTLPADHRVAGAAWVLRQHASSRHAGGALLLADCWHLLLPYSRDPPQLAAVKVKALGACLSAGVGDEEAICRAVAGWDGFSGGSDHQLRAFTYALRILHASAPASGPAAHRLHACLAASILEAIVARPALVPGVDAFLAGCAGLFAVNFLRAFDALLAGVDGQFEALRERPEDAPFKGTTTELADRVKAAVISRSSSLSGLMRGLSFRLSFTKRAQSSLFLPGGPPLTARSASVAVSLAATPRGAPSQTVGRVPPLDVRALRSSVSAAFQQQASTAAAGVPAGAGVAPIDNLYTPFSARSGAGGAPLSSVGDGVSESIFSGDGDALGDGDGGPTAAAVAVPRDLPSAEAAEAWLAAPATWEALAPGLLRHDLLSYRLLLLRTLRCGSIQPTGALRTLANFAWQYKEAHPTHALSGKDAGAAILALCHAAAVAHLTTATGAAEWTSAQLELAEGVRSVLDAVEEGFPVPAVRERCSGLASLLANANAWSADAWPVTSAALLAAFVDAAVQG